jgi:hypothetical protein
VLRIKNNGQAKIPIRKNGQYTYVSTIDWAAEQLSKGKNLDDAVNNLKYRATELMNSNQVRKLPGYKRRIAFVGAGFDEVECGSKKIRLPLRIMIENCLGNNGTLLDQPRDDFKDHYDPLKNCDAALYIAGQRFDEKKEFEFTRLLRRFVQHNAKPEKIGMLLTSKIQEIAKVMPNGKRSVGENIMCIFVPQAYCDRNDGNGMMIPITGGILLATPTNSTETQILKPVEFPSLKERIVILPSFDSPNSHEFDSPRFAYIAEDNSAQPYHNPVYVRPGQVVPTITSTEMSIKFVPTPNLQEDNLLHV